LIARSEDGPGDYAVDEKTKQATLTEDGHQKVEELMRRSACCATAKACRRHQYPLMHHLNAALRAHACTSAMSNTSCQGNDHRR